MELVALLSKGEGSWGQVSGLIKKGEWSKIVLLGPSFASDFKIEGFAFDFIEYDSDKTLSDLRDFFVKKLQDKLGEDFSDVALSIASGGGKEHMALISAIQAIPRGIRFCALTKDGIVYL
jgi:hypothetical protein